MAGQPATSGTYSFQPALAEWLTECFSRIQIYPSAIEDIHIIEGRRSANLVLSDLSNRGANLWLIGDELLTIPLIPGQATYQLPGETVTVLDTYLRQYTPSSTYATIGNALTPMSMANGQPMLEATGEPMLMAPLSGVFSTTQGSARAMIHWPRHGLGVGSPVFFQLPVTLGPASMGPTTFAAVVQVIDGDNVAIDLPFPAPATRVGVGGTPLFVTTSGSGLVDVILPGHGLVPQNTFTVQIPTTVGGLMLSGEFTVTAVASSYRFTIMTSGSATSGASGFENGGQLLVATQAAGVQYTDTLLWPVSRNDYAAFPNKFVQGRPSVFWFDRTIVPSISIWATAQANSTWAVVCFRMREAQDANPVMGQQVDLPRRAFPAFTAFLTAYLAEKFRPEAFATKLLYAEQVWDRFANADREMVSAYIVPQIQSYFRGR